MRQSDGYIVTIPEIYNSDEYKQVYKTIIGNSMDGFIPFKTKEDQTKEDQIKPELLTKKISEW